MDCSERITLWNLVLENPTSRKRAQAASHPVMRHVRLLESDRERYGHGAPHTQEMPGTMCAHSLLSAPSPTSPPFFHSTMSEKKQEPPISRYSGVNVLCTLLIRRKSTMNEKNKNYPYPDTPELICTLLIRQKSQKNTYMEFDTETETRRVLYPLRSRVGLWIWSPWKRCLNK